METVKSAKFEFVGSKLHSGFDKIGFVKLVDLMYKVGSTYFVMAHHKFDADIDSKYANLYGYLLSDKSKDLTPVFKNTDCIDPIHLTVLNYVKKMREDYRGFTRVSTVKYYGVDTEAEDLYIPAQMRQWCHEIYNIAGPSGLVLAPDASVEDKQKGKNVTYCHELHEFGPNYPNNKTSFAHYINEEFKKLPDGAQHQVLKKLEYVFMAQQVFCLVYGFYPRFLRDLTVEVIYNSNNEIELQDVDCEYLQSILKPFDFARATDASIANLEISTEYIMTFRRLNLVKWVNTEESSSKNKGKETKADEDEGVSTFIRMQSKLNPEVRQEENEEEEEEMECSRNQTSETEENVKSCEEEEMENKENMENNEDVKTSTEDKAKSYKDTFKNAYKNMKEKTREMKEEVKNKGRNWTPSGMWKSYKGLSLRNKILVGCGAVIVVTGAAYLGYRLLSDDDGTEILDTGDVPFSLDGDLNFV